MTSAVIVEADGGSRGNPGPAGFGAVVFSADRAKVLAERAEFIGVATNNVAEYRGLIAGLAAAAELGARTVAVRMDSKLVVEQMEGRWQVKHPAMIPLAQQARSLVAGFDRVSFTWIPRAENSHADRLANVAMDDGNLGETVRMTVETGQRSGEARATDATAGHDAQSTSAAAPGTSAVDVADRSAASGTPSADLADPPAASGTPAVDFADRPAPSGTPALDLAASGTASPKIAVSDRLAAPGDSSSPGKSKSEKSPGWTGAMGQPTRLYLLRHGQTALSVDRRYSGRGNPPLTELGRQQADAAARHLKSKGDIAAVVTSPLDRAHTTAQAAASALNVPLRVLDGLTETDFGQWEGLTFAEAAKRDPMLHTEWLGNPAVPAPDGESFDQVRARVEGVRRELLAEYPGQNVVVVSHVTPIKTMLQLALGVGPSLLYRLHLDLASTSIAEFYPDGGSSVRLINDTSYL
ncbi:histidine phosphatase family protein [Nocardia camponoti]|uniref:Bifunctional RNase H/acid phosphatase n=1 Tax=Nocardia camponoti TaxID=1616106 RepID=A0A917VBH4_9NOCA|nr:histidine phosphatase family protein [Nocardia camponoti]GGK61483.1 bifunctional RNase H/acid phosphatase [Nocardia camponoti]